MEKQKHGRLYRSSERIFDWILETYSRGLGWVLRHQPLTLAVTIATACLSVSLYICRAQGLLPAAGYGADYGQYPSVAGYLVLALRQKMSNTRPSWRRTRRLPR